MKIGLVCQTYFSMNYGVSALNHSAINILNRIFNGKYDLVLFCQDEDIEHVKKDINIRYNINSIEVYPIIQPKQIKSYYNYYKNIKFCDYILDTSLGDGFSDIYSKRKCFLQCILKEIPIIMNKKLILLPQTIGPYYNSLFSKWAKRILNKSEAVFVRDNISYELCKQLYSGDNVHITSDMALMLPYSQSDYIFKSNNKMKIGLNISGLLYNGGYNKNNQFNLKFDYKEFIIKLVKELNKDEDVELFLVSHVFSKGIEDDYASCVEIYNLFDLDESPLVFESPMSAKSFISNMDVFIGSRMHSTIAALSSNVVTIPIGYSRKFNGLFDQLQYKYYIDATQTTLFDSVELVKKYIKNRLELKNATDITQTVINKYNKELIIKLSEVLGATNE